MAARARGRDTGSSRGAQSGGARSDAYTGLLLISLLAQIVGVVFFYLDWSAYPQGKPAVPQMPNLSAPSAAPMAPPAGGPAGMGGMPPMGGGAPPMAGGAPPMAGGAPPMAGGMPPMAGGMPN